jgi:ABC-type sulfate/molybdate transport systems ATPase subunit
MSQFSHAGVSKLNGEFKVRFANDATRVKVLIKNGHTDIDIIELKQPMSKEDAVAYLMEIDFATRDGKTNEAVQAALAAEIDKRSPTAKAEKAPKAPKVKAEKPTMDKIKAKVAAKKAEVKPTPSKAEVIAQLANMEDAPF